MTESELLASSDFLAWCGAWERDRHCPLPMADWALENVGELAFEACVWAHEKEKSRQLYLNYQSRPMPCQGSSKRWEINDIVSWGGGPYADEFPIVTPESFDSFPAAIAYYLTHFDRELAAKYPPKRALATV